MAYSYDRTAADKTWYDMFSAAQGVFMGKVTAELAKLLKGKAEEGAFGSGTVNYSGGAVHLGFMGGSVGMVYVVDPSDKRTEHSVVNHTPKTFAAILLKRNVLPAAT